MVLAGFGPDGKIHLPEVRGGVKNWACTIETAWYDISVMTEIAVSMKGKL
jgi:hypothetical protein